MQYVKPMVLALFMAVLGTAAQAQVVPGPGGAQIIPIPTDVYAVKFLCGTYTGGGASGVLREGPVKPGNYQTAINIHNPNRTASILFTKKAVLMFDSLNPPTDFERPMPPGHKIEAGLKPDWGMEIDCPDIRAVLLNQPTPGAKSFIKGWVVIEVSGKILRPLDVVAAYTAHGFSLGDQGFPLSPEGFSMQILPVTPKRVK